MKPVLRSIAIMSNVSGNSTVTLGPGTGDLKLRVGIHSGPVTAGVLRGDRSRFQLFGVSRSDKWLSSQ